MMPGLGAVGGGDSSEAAFATGMLAGAGLRELSQVLGLSKKRQAKGAGGAMPTSGQMMEGNLGELDKIMLLARLQQAAAGPMGGAVPDPLAAAAPPGLPAPPLPGLPGPGLPGPGLPGPGPMPMGAPPVPIPPPPAAGAPGGQIPLQMLLQMLQGAGGMV